MDATFVQLGDEDIHNLKSNGRRFLEVASEWDRSDASSDDVFVFQHPQGSDIHLASGRFLKCYGLDVFHSASTDYGSSGSPVLLTNGQVVALHKARSAKKSSEYNVAVMMKAIINAVRPHYCGPAIPRHLVCNPIMLNQTYVSKLIRIGLQRCFVISEGSTDYQGLMYVSPASKVLGLEYITPIWFVPTSHGWYWTPTNPSDQKETNWMPVSRLQVIGGFWHDQIPAPKNVKIINWLYQYNIECGICPKL